MRLMQLLLLAAYHPERPWATLVVELLGMLSSLPASGGINYIRVCPRYLLQTQNREVIESFQEVLRHQAPAVGDELVTYAQALLAEGKAEGPEEGRIEERVRMIENLLQEGMAWLAIERIPGVIDTQFQALEQRLEAMNHPG